jgi:hypothetical protein
MSRPSRALRARSVTAAAVATLVVVTLGAAATGAASASPMTPRGPATAPATATASTPATTSTTSDHPELAPLSRPFAMPGFKEQEFNGALFVGEGETRFSVSVDLLTKDGKVINENMVPSIWRLGPIATDGSYYEIELSTDDRVITKERLGGLRATIDHPESWSATDVANAQAQLPGLQAKYDAMQAGKRNVVVRYARVDDTELVGSVTALDDDTSVWLDASAPWLEPSTYAVDGPSSLTGSSAGIRDASRTGYFRVDTDAPSDASASWATVKDMVAGMVGKPAAAGQGAAALRYELSRGETVTFTAHLGDSPVPQATRTKEETLAFIADARAHVDDGSVHGSGEVGRAATFMRDAMALNANYDEKYDRSFVMWGLGGGGDDIFKGWDSGWDGITAGSLDPALGLDHVRDFYDQNGGPRYDQLNAGPMHAYLAWRTYTRTGDKSILELVYPYLTSYIARMPEFDTDKDGLLESPWAGPRLGGRGNHLGLDDSPQYANFQQVVTDGTDNRDNTNLTDVALNSYYGLFAENLSQMATALDKPDDAARYAALKEQLKTRMNAHLWNADRGLYLNRYLDGSWEPTNTPTVFYPLFGGLATQDRAKVLVEDHLLDPDEFWGEYAVPSVARNDPAFCSAGDHHPGATGYEYFQKHLEEDACEEWKGAVWPPMNATVYDGLKRYGFDKPAADLATKSTKLWLTTWEELGWFPEYFDPEPGQVINSAATDTTWRTYSWSNLMPLMGTHELIADEPWGNPAGFRFGTLGLPGTNEVDGVPLHGHRYDVTAGPTATVVHEDGLLAFNSTGGRVVVRDFVLTSSGATFTIKADRPTKVFVHPRGGGKPLAASLPAGTTSVTL